MDIKINDQVFTNLRKKLDVLGYKQHILPLTAIPLVGALFEDLVKTTKSLRDSKEKFVNLLEEKSCWELGVEPYKCDNARLIAECNRLHQQSIKDREYYEKLEIELNKKIRRLENDKQHLDEHCQQLQKSISKHNSNAQAIEAKLKNDNEVNTYKKPFISTVRAEQCGKSAPLIQNFNKNRCTKCNSGYSKKKTISVIEPPIESKLKLQKKINELECIIKDITEKISFYERKVEDRNREIERLNSLIEGGRSTAAIAKDCCYKDLGKLSEDVQLLQREKLVFLTKIQDYQEEMHEAKQRAINLDLHNKQIIKDLKELKETALQVEAQANNELELREREIEKLKIELQNMYQNGKHFVRKSSKVEKIGSENVDAGIDKRLIKERINELTQRESELKFQNERMQKKIQKLKHKISCMNRDNMQSKVNEFEEERVRIKSERDFYEKEYLRLMSTKGSEKEIEFLQSQINVKDEELKSLRLELYGHEKSFVGSKENISPSSDSVKPSTRTDVSKINDCVHAVVMRVQRELESTRAELERILNERNALRDHHAHITQIQDEETQKSHQIIRDLNKRINELEKENKCFNCVQLPSEEQYMLLREENAELKHHISTLQKINSNLKKNLDQSKCVQQHTERSLVDYQNKVIITDQKLDSALVRLNNLDCSRNTALNEIEQLRKESTAFKKIYSDLELEKKTLMGELHKKTDKINQLEFELKSSKEKLYLLEKNMKQLEQKLETINLKSIEQSSEMQETKSLRQKIIALKVSHDQAIIENGRLSNTLSDCRDEILTLRKAIKESDMEIDRLKKQLRQYVQEVKKAEDLLIQKEKEREEMLEHYRSLSHDAVLLEGNNQSLEIEAIEHRRQIGDLETEMEALKKEVICSNDIIAQHENKIALLATQKEFLEHQLEEINDEQRLIKVDLAAHKELCEKLDIQRDKLNAELLEINEIRRKLENENSKLRMEVNSINTCSEVNAETLEGLLSNTRKDLEEQIKVDSKLSTELKRLREKNKQLLVNLADERAKCRQNEAIVREVEEQNLELRHNITEDRFREARTRNKNSCIPTQSLNCIN